MNREIADYEIGTTVFLLVEGGKKRIRTDWFVRKENDFLQMFGRYTRRNDGHNKSAEPGLATSIHLCSVCIIFLLRCQTQTSLFFLREDSFSRKEYFLLSYGPWESIFIYLTHIYSSRWGINNLKATHIFKKWIRSGFCMPLYKCSLCFTKCERPFEGG